MKAIQDGVIQRVSPSMLTTFDSTSAFGCARRGYFKYVLGIKEPTTDAMTVGTHLHAMNEEYLRSGKMLLGTEEQTAWFRAGQKFLDGLRSGFLPEYAVVGVEQPMPEGFTVEGVPVSEMSKCDVVTEAGIIDWKTTSSIEKYGKTPGALAQDVQMLIYAQAFHPDAQEVSLTHGQYQTKGKPLFFESTVKLSRKELDANYGRVIKPLVATVRDVAQQKEAKAVPPNRNACRLCPHKAICPADKENPLMSIFNKFRTPAAPVAPAPILPPDAPKSDPALAAKPVEGFEAVPPPRKMTFVDVLPEPAPTAPATPVAKAEAAPPPAPAPAVEEPKKRAGRPPGSKNKPKDEVITYTPEKFPTEKAAEAYYFEFESVTVNYGVTMNMGDFNSVRIDVSMSARHGGDADAAYTKVMDAVKAKVEAEMVLLKQVK